MIIGFVRHGQTDWNASGRIQGQTDIPLNEAGRRQAQALAERLVSEDRRWDAVISSDLSRAKETARIIADTIGAPLLDGDARLRERAFGLMEGTTAAERIDQWDDHWPIDAAGAESEESLKQRAHSFIEHWRRQNPTLSLLVVSHGGFLASMLPMLCAELTDEHLGNLSYSILQRKADGWVPLLYNCTAHIRA